MIAPLMKAAPAQPSGAGANFAAPASLTAMKRSVAPSSSSASLSGSPPSGSSFSPFATATSSLSQPVQVVAASAATHKSMLAGSAAQPAGAGAGPAGADAARAIQTFSCPDCGRSFKRGSLMKHQRICKKVFKQKREQFDSGKARTHDLVVGEEDEEGEDDEDEDGAEDRPRTAAPKKVPAATAASKGAGREETKEEAAAAAAAASAKNWKDESQGLREAMRRAKQEKARFAQSNALGIDMKMMMMHK